MQERRKIPRWQINTQAIIKLEGEPCEAICLVKDINFKGMQIVLHSKLDLDSYIKFSLTLSPEFSFEVEAWVAWHRQAEASNIYGLYFSKLKDPDKEKIYKFICENAKGEIAKCWWNEVVKNEGGEVMEDRRIFQRFNARFPAKLLDLNTGMEIPAETFDVSAKGIGLVLKQDLAKNTPVEAWIQIPDRGEPLYSRGISAWSRQENESEYRAGLDLERADLMGLSRVLRI